MNPAVRRVAKAIGYGESGGYTDCVGDIAGARLGPYTTKEAAQADYAARQAAKKQVPVPFEIRQETFKGVAGWYVVNTTWGASIGWFQDRSIRPTYTGPMNAADKLRIASLLRDPLYNAKVAFAISKGGTDFSPWTVYREDIYKQYLDRDYPLRTGHARADDWDV